MEEDLSGWLNEAAPASSARPGRVIMRKEPRMSAARGTNRTGERFLRVIIVSTSVTSERVTESEGRERRADA
jgi:hypothetical protein